MFSYQPMFRSLTHWAFNTYAAQDGGAEICFFNFGVNNKSHPELFIQKPLKLTTSSASILVFHMKNKAGDTKKRHKASRAGESAPGPHRGFAL